MTNDLEIFQGDVWEIAFSDEDERPGVIVTRNELNKGRLVLVVPCTASQVETRKIHTNNVFLPAGSGGLDQPTVVQVHLIQPVDKVYFVRQRGCLADEQLGEILHALAWAVELYE